MLWPFLLSLIAPLLDLVGHLLDVSV